MESERHRFFLFPRLGLDSPLASSLRRQGREEEDFLAHHVHRLVALHSDASGEEPCRNDQYLVPIWMHVERVSAGRLCILDRDDAKAGLDSNHDGLERLRGINLRSGHYLFLESEPALDLLLPDGVCLLAGEPYLANLGARVAKIPSQGGPARRC